MEKYRILQRVGEGAHGVVFRAKEIANGRTVALKRVPIRRLQDGIPNAVLREAKALEQLEHENVVSLLNVFPHGTGIALVFEYMLSDLAVVIRNLSTPLSEAQVKSYMCMLLKGVSFCHSRSIMHRDLKPANLLISPSGRLKIADFGLARVYSKDIAQYSHEVATRWYRAPELLYGGREYGLGVDLWAVGCILGELINHSPLFRGENDIDQLYVVLRTLGTPTPEDWPQMESLPDYNKITFPDMPAVPFEQIIPEASPEALHLFGRFLIYAAEKRISAADALVHPYFFSEPLPAHHSDLPIPKFRGAPNIYRDSVSLEELPAMVNPAALPRV